MDKLKIHSFDSVERNVDKIGKLFPNCFAKTIHR